MHHTYLLSGCTPSPLIHYLKALGILRLLANQLDQSVRGAWTTDGFLVQTVKSREEILSFFHNQYAPTPILSPWNRSSGFYPEDKKSKDLINTLWVNKSDRIHNYRQTVEVAREIVNQYLEIGSRDTRMDIKTEILHACRRAFPDAAIEWLDTAYVLGSQKPEYPPLVGTGGNDGRFDFTVNFVSRLLETLPEFLKTEKKSTTKIDVSRAQLAYSLFASGSPPLEKAGVGQFHPAGAGGANSSEGASGESLVNPWDYILAIEGTLVMSSAAVRQLQAGARSKAAFPFTVSNSNVGYGTAADGEKIRAEVWLPVWSRLSSYAETSHIFREGRVQFSTRKKSIRSGFDFARAVAELGADRGIDAFQRYAFIERNGQANFATPLGLFQVKERPLANLIHQADRWLDNFSREAAGDRTPPRLAKVVRQVEESIFQLCEGGSVDQLREVLIRLGAAEFELSRSEKFRQDRALRPLQGLKLSWLHKCDDGSPEFIIAAALASIRAQTPDDPLRKNIEPLKFGNKGLEWGDGSTSSVWGMGNLAHNLASILHRRSIDARSRGLSHPVISGSRFANLEDIEIYLNLETDDDRLNSLLLGLILIDWPTSVFKLPPYRKHVVPPTLPRAYALLKLLFLPDGKLTLTNGTQIIIRHEPSIIPLLLVNRVQEAIAIAYQRLQSSGLIPATRDFHYSGGEGARLASSLLIPLAPNSICDLANLVLRNNEPQQ